MCKLPLMDWHYHHGGIHTSCPVLHEKIKSTNLYCYGCTHIQVMKTFYTLTGCSCHFRCLEPCDYQILHICFLGTLNCSLVIHLMQVYIHVKKKPNKIKKE